MSKRWFTKVILWVFLSLLCSGAILQFSPGETDPNLVFVNCYGLGLLYHEPMEIFQMISIMPVLLLCFFFSGHLRDEFVGFGSVIFTRDRKRGRWYNRKVLSLFRNVVVCYLLSVLLFLLMMAVYGYPVEKLDVALMSQVLFLQILWGFVLTLLFNSISLFIRDVFTFSAGAVLVLGFSLVQVQAYGNGFDEWLKWSPFSQSIYLWHTTDYTYLQMFSPIGGFDWLFSLVYLVLGMVVIYFIGYLLVVKKDVYGNERE